MRIDQYLDGRRNLRSIQRFAMEPTIKNQNLCDHGYNVATLFYIVMGSLGRVCTARDLFLVMQHDFVESMTGDLNKLVKEKNDRTRRAWETIECEVVPEELNYLCDAGLRELLSSEDYEVFKFCDLFEAWIYCLEERAMGNTMLSRAQRHYVTRLHEISHSNKVFKGMVEEARGRYIW